jgi:hypothetical protein
MLPLLNAIYTKFTASSALVAAFPGGLFRDRAPEGTTMPYLVSHVAGSKVEYAYEGVYRADTQIRFSGYGVGHDATGNALAILLANLDDVTLTLSSGTNDSVTRSGEPTPTLHRHDSQGNEVWEWSVTYNYSVVG